MTTSNIAGAIGESALRSPSRDEDSQVALLSYECAPSCPFVTVAYRCYTSA